MSVNTLIPNTNRIIPTLFSLGCDCYASLGWYRADSQGKLREQKTKNVERAPFLIYEQTTINSIVKLFGEEDYLNTVSNTVVRSTWCVLEILSWWSYFSLTFYPVMLKETQPSNNDWVHIHWAICYRLWFGKRKEKLIFKITCDPPKLYQKTDTADKHIQ